ncbi:MAG: MHYT domain-containing protein, partial [Bdellovibrionales bacterium]
MLVVASYVIAVFGSYAGLTVATQLFSAQSEQQKKVLNWLGAFALGGGIWSMHFIGMLAYKMDMAMSYDPALTGISLFIAIYIAYSVLLIVRSQKLSPAKFAVAVFLLGLCIGAMHYTGMAAMRVDADLRYRPGLFLLSNVIAILVSGVALNIILSVGKYRTRHEQSWKIAGALIMGAGICGMHYTGMAAAVLLPYANCRRNPDQNFDLLATVVGSLSIAIVMATLAQDVFSKKQPVRKTGSASFYSRLLPIVILLGLSGFLVFLILQNSERDYALALEYYRKNSSNEANIVA